MLDAGHDVEKFAGHVRGAAGTGRCHVDLAGVGLGVGDEFRNGFGRNRRMHQNRHRHPDDAGDRGNVANEIEIEFFEQRGVDRVGHGRQQQRIAVCGGIGHDLGAEIAAGTGPVFGDKGHSEPLGKPLSDQPRGDVDAPARRVGDDDTRRPRRIGLRPTETGSARKHGGTSGQMQKSATQKFHDVPLGRATCGAIPSNGAGF